ncbi:MAG: GMC oxidoreductase [Gemmatimonadales bacterium]
MDIDARTIRHPTSLEADVCIVGSGPAGLTLAGALDDLDVVVLESGGIRPEPWTLALNEARTIGSPYAGLGQTRHRQTGGAAQMWNTPIAGAVGAKYVPLDPWDLEAHPEAIWPFDYSELVPWYRRAQEVCALGPFEYDAAYWSTPERPCLDLPDWLVTRIYQAGPARRFTDDYLGALRLTRKARLIDHATATGLEFAPLGRTVQAVQVLTPDRHELTVRARAIILAGGAVENTRLLLLSDWEDRSGWLGRGFMEHPRDSGLTLIPHSPEFARQAGFYDLHRARDGTVIGGRIAISGRAILEEPVPNASVSLFPRWKDSPKTLRERLTTRLFGRPETPAGGYGWWERLAGTPPPDFFQLLVNLEQRPHPENRIVLATERDPLGTPRVELHWRWREEEQRELERLRERIATGLEQAGWGRVTIQRGTQPDPNAHHHAGTTRMHADPGHGVVDPDGRVQGTKNLYVAGASVFPSAGFANPVLTIVALALRLAAAVRHVL